MGHESMGADEVASLDYEAVRLVNQAFYDAFEAKDATRLLDVWEHSQRVQCGHPGWSILRGWDEVGASWAALTEGPEHIQFVLTNERIEVIGDVAWVTVDENILGSQTSGTVSAINIFARTDEGWKLISHHGNMVMQR